MSKACCAPAPDRSGRQCDKPIGHDGDHWTYGGDEKTWPQMTTTPTIHTLLTEARRLEGERARTDAHFNPEIRLQNVVEFLRACPLTEDNRGAAVVSLMSVDPLKIIAFWRTHAPAILAYVGELEQELAIARLEVAPWAELFARVGKAEADRDRLAGEVAQMRLALDEEGGFTRLERSRAEKAEAEVTSLKVEVERLRKPINENEAQRRALLR